MNSFNIDMCEDAGRVVVRMEGEGGYRMVDDLDALFRRVLAVRPRLVILDLTTLDFAASLFLGAMVRFRKDVVRGGGQVQIAGVRPRIAELFEVTQLAQFFEFLPAVPEASVSA